MCRSIEGPVFDKAKKEIYPKEIIEELENGNQSLANPQISTFQNQIRILNAMKAKELINRILKNNENTTPCIIHC